MKKTSYLQELRDIKEMTAKMSNVLNESIAYEDEYDTPEFQGEEEEEEVDVEEAPVGEPVGESQELDNEVDTIREIALKGMVKLCKMPNDPRYQFLKKVFSFCDKAAESENNEEQPNK